MSESTLENFTLPKKEVSSPLSPAPNSESSLPIPEPTGEIYSAQFPDMVVANDELYDRRQKRKTTPTPGEQPESAPRGSVYMQMALTEENGLEKAIEQWKHDKAEKFLISAGALTKSESGSFVLTASGKEDLLKHGWTAWNNGTTKKLGHRAWQLSPEIIEKYALDPSEHCIRLTSQDFFSYLKQCSAIDAECPEQSPLPVTKIPNSLQEVLDGKFSGAHLKPWEMPVGTTSWVESIALSDGTTSNMAELAIADILHKLHARRDAKGILLVDDPATHAPIQFSTTILRTYLPNIVIDRSASFFSRPSEFTQKYLSGLSRLGVMTSNDFRKMSNLFAEDSIVAPTDRVTNSHLVSLITPEGKSVVYYVGRGKIVGTEILLDNSNTVIRYLDKTTCAFVQKNKDGNEVILATFPLLSPEEAETRRNETRLRLEQAGKSASERELASRTVIGGPEMSTRVRPYQVSDFAPQFPGESAKEYADRIAKLSDTRLVSKTTREFFQRYNIGLHQLPWAEQLAASSVLIDPRFSKEKIGAFCERFGIDGLRTFISSTYGKNINRDILAFGEKAPELAKRTFKKYSEVLAMVDEAESSLRSFGIAEKLDADKRERSIRDIKGQLTQKAKGVLEKIATSVQQTKTLSKSTLTALEAELASSQGDALLYLNTFKVLKENGVLQSLSEAEK